MDDLISRAAAIERATKDHDFYKGATTPADKARRDELLNVMCWLGELPSAQPYTDEEIQKMQDIEQAQFDKIRELAYQEGKADAMAEIIRCRDCVWHDVNVCRNKNSIPWKDDDFCSWAERREVSE